MTSGASSPNCSSAQAVTVTAGQTVTDKNFQLDPAGTISGTVKDHNNNPITSGRVNVFTGAPCNDHNDVGQGNLRPDGSYVTRGLPAGTYYLRADSDGIQVSEWWASGASSPNCSAAQTVTVTAGLTTPDKNFQLDLGGTISGTVKDHGNNPITSGDVEVYSGDPCDPYYKNNEIGRGRLLQDGTYVTRGLAAGTYYLRAESDGNHVSEWWASGASTPNCSSAQTLTVTAGQTTPDTNFQLDPGGIIRGKVTSSDGPVTKGWIPAFTGDPCSVGSYVHDGKLNSDGTYEITGLAAGEYFVLGAVDDYYAAEWWTSSGDNMVCSSAEAVSVQAGTTVSDKDFFLASGGMISGKVTGSNDIPTPATGVIVYTGNPCEYKLIGHGEIRSDGTYVTSGLAAGSYFLRTEVYGTHTPEWWTSSGGILECSKAEPVWVEIGKTVTGKDFSHNLIPPQKKRTIFPIRSKDGQTLILSL